MKKKEEKERRFFSLVKETASDGIVAGVENERLVR